MIPLRHAAAIIRAGGVVAYPTEGVFGFGCRPDDADAVFRILAIKEREWEKGLLLIASGIEQLEGWVDLPDNPPDLTCTIDRPVTWIMPATEQVPEFVRGTHAGIGVRLTAHPVAKALAHYAGMPIVSTSANRAGRPPARSPWVLRRQFASELDAIVPGRCGPATGPSEIRDLATGRVLRPA